MSEQTEPSLCTTWRNIRVLKTPKNSRYATKQSIRNNSRRQVLAGPAALRADEQNSSSFLDERLQIFAVLYADDLSRRHTRSAVFPRHRELHNLVLPFLLVLIFILPRERVIFDVSSQPTPRTVRFARKPKPGGVSCVNRVRVQIQSPVSFPITIASSTARRSLRSTRYIPYECSAAEFVPSVTNSTLGLHYRSHFSSRVKSAEHCWRVFPPARAFPRGSLTNTASRSQYPRGAFRLVKKLRRPQDDTISGEANTTRSTVPHCPHFGCMLLEGKHQGDDEGGRRMVCSRQKTTNTGDHS